MEETKKARFSAGRLTFAVRHELWDGNIQDHPDQGVAILVVADVAGKETRCCGSTASTSKKLRLRPGKSGLAC
jgi:hypothetical protein